MCIDAIMYGEGLYFTIVSGTYDVDRVRAILELDDENLEEVLKKGVVISERQLTELLPENVRHGFVKDSRDKR